MLRRRWKLILPLLFVILLLLGIDHFFQIMWVGHTDLDVVFLISDAETGKPIPGAQIEIKQERGGFYENTDAMEFSLITSDTGFASRECRFSMCFGSSSLLTINNTFVVHLPLWTFRVRAENYRASDWIWLDKSEYIRQAKRNGDGKSKLVVPISLTKN